MALCCIIFVRSQVALMGKIANNSRPIAKSSMTSPPYRGAWHGRFCDGSRIICDFSHERHLATRKYYTTQRDVNSELTRSLRVNASVG